MAEIFAGLVPVAIGLVFVVLVVGIFVMFRGGKTAHSWSNRLMRLRVLMQFIAILIIMGALYFAGRS